MTTRLGITRLLKPALCLLPLLTACGNSTEGAEPGIGEGNFGDANDSIPIEQAHRSTVLDVNARTSELTYKFDLPDPFTNGPDLDSVYSWEMVPMGDINGDQVDDLAFNLNSGHRLSRIIPGQTGGWPDSQKNYI